MPQVVGKRVRRQISFHNLSVYCRRHHVARLLFSSQRELDLYRIAGVKPGHHRIALPASRTQRKLIHLHGLGGRGKKQEWDQNRHVPEYVKSGGEDVRKTP